MSKKNDHLKRFIYSLRDVTTDTYGSLFVCQNDLEAQRNVRAFLQNDPTSILALNSLEYTLCKIGVFNLQSGFVDADYEMICNVHQLQSNVDQSKFEKPVLPSRRYNDIVNEIVSQASE